MKVKDETKTNGRNKNDNYKIQFNIDDDITDYFKNIQWVYFLEKRRDMNMTQYINCLIRKDMLELLKLDDKATPQEIKTKWYEYKRKNNI